MVLKEAKVPTHDIIDISSFMDSFVDVNLMDDSAAELVKRFEIAKLTKILTVATTDKAHTYELIKQTTFPSSASFLNG